MTIEEKIMNVYESGKFQPLGADGGLMRYMACTIDGKAIKASITRDNEIAKIRAVWELTIDGEKVYDFTSAYYKLRK